MWECCDGLTRLSTDNRAACIRILLSQLRLLRDASLEIDEVHDNGTCT